MPLIKRSVSIPAGGSANPLSGSQYEYLPFDAAVEIAAVADAAGINGNIFSGSDVLLENSELDVLAAPAPMVYPDHFTLADVAAAGERLGLTLTNTTAGAVVARVAVRITPL